MDGIKYKKKGSAKPPVARRPAPNVVTAMATQQTEAAAEAARPAAPVQIDFAGKRAQRKKERAEAAAKAAAKAVKAEKKKKKKVPRRDPCHPPAAVRNPLPCDSLIRTPRTCGHPVVQAACPRLVPAPPFPCL